MTINIIKKKKEIKKIFKDVSTAKDLDPTKRINESFSRLVHIVMETSKEVSDAILQDAEIISLRDDLRRLSSKAESRLELHWAQKILASSNPKTSLSSFIYYDNYKKLCALETASMDSCGMHSPHKVLFIGSGPLPLSAILMVEKNDFQVDTLDSDPEACKISRALVSKLGLGHRISIIENNILNIKDLSSYNVIFIAALAGETESEKKKIIDHVTAYSTSGTHIIMRSVEDLGTLLYPEITKDHLQDIEVTLRTSMPKDVINSLIIGKRK